MNTKDFKTWVAGLPDDAAIEFKDDSSYQTKWVKLQANTIRAISTMPDEPNTDNEEEPC